METVGTAVEACLVDDMYSLAAFHRHIRQIEPVYAELMELKEKVMNNWQILVASRTDVKCRDGRIRRVTNTFIINDVKLIMQRAKQPLGFTK